MREMNGKGQNIKINTYVSVSISMMMLDFFYFCRNENDLNVDKNWLNFVVHFISKCAVLKVNKIAKLDMTRKLPTANSIASLFSIHIFAPFKIYAHTCAINKIGDV